MKGNPVQLLNKETTRTRTKNKRTFCSGGRGWRRRAWPEAPLRKCPTGLKESGGNRPGEKARSVDRQEKGNVEEYSVIDKKCVGLGRISGARFCLFQRLREVTNDASMKKSLDQGAEKAE